MMSPSPSFNSFSNSHLVEVAARVVDELRAEDGDEFYCKNRESIAGESDIPESHVTRDDCKEDGGFEFSSIAVESSDYTFSTISADDIFRNGKMLPFSPIFSSNRTQTNSVSHKLITTTSSSSASDADELDGIPSELYCLWRPKAVEHKPRKMNSFSGSDSKKWKIKDFLRRSFSIGSKDSLALSSPSDGGRKREAERIRESATGHRTVRNESFFYSSPSNGGRRIAGDKVTAPAIAAGKSTPSPYNRGGEKRRSYLPYRWNLVGFFANMNGLHMNVQPF